MKVNSSPIKVRLSKRKPPAVEAKPPEDPIEFLVQSRRKEREDWLKAREQLAKLIYETQKNLLAIRAKANLARLKIVNKAFDG